MKKLFLSLLIIGLTTFAFAQKGSISGTLLDSVNQKEPLAYSTATVYQAKDSSLVAYKLSDDKGVFKVSGLPLGIPLRIVVSGFRYNVFRKEFTLSTDKPDLQLGTLLFTLKKNNLNEVEIVAERPPIVVRKDTIEFNAESFKTLPTAVVEDLLKKLPGVSIATDGSIKVNGKPVSKILVDGKEFFGGDQQIATKNLPANIIDKVQVTNDKEAMRNDPDLIAANTPQVINLKLKRAIKQGAFGKLYGGGGPDDHYEGGGIFNIFRDTAQVSVLAYGNNVNRPGFSIGDVQRIGGFSRSGVSSVWINSDGGYGLDGISFGGSSNGIQKSAGAGANFNTLTKKGIKINTKYFFGQSNNRVLQSTNDDQTLGTNRLIGISSSDQLNRSYSHNFGGKVEWKIDSLTSLNFTPSVSIGLVRNNNQMDKQSTDASNNLVNKAGTRSRQNGNNQEFSLNTYLYKNYKKVGRQVTMGLTLTQRNALNDNFNYSSTQIYSPASTKVIDQFRDEDVTGFNGLFNGNYSEPISKKLSFSGTVTGTYLSNENALSTFYKAPGNSDYTVVAPSLTETVEQSGLKSTARARLRWKLNDKLTLRPGIQLNTINLQNRFINYPDFKQNFVFVGGTMNIAYKDFSLDYTPSFVEPDVRYIQPVANNTDPLFIQNGNSALRPATSHRLSANLYKADTKHSLNYNLYFYSTLNNNAVIQSRTIDASGVQTSTPVNADGVINMNGGLNFGKDFKKNKKQLSIGLGMWSNFSRNVLLVNGNRSYAKIWALSPSGSIRLNLNDKLEINQNLYGSVNNSAYDDSFFRDQSFVTYNSETELIIRLPKKFVWESNFRSQVNKQNLAGYNNNIRLWNAGLTYLFLKNDRAQLKFSVNDLLNTNVRRWAYITDNSVRNVQSNNIGRFGLLTLTYNIQNFGQKVGGRDRFFSF